MLPPATLNIIQWVCLPADQAYYMRQARRIIEKASQYEPSLPRSDDVVQRERPLYPLASSELRHWFPASTQMYYWVRVDQDLAHLGLGLELYELKEGSYPEHLDDLGGRLGWNLPSDPYGPGVYSYHQEPGGYVLYSWGQDQDDDGGLSMREARMHGKEGGDIVFRPRPTGPLLEETGTAASSLRELGGTL
jgi:hypothetical protein